MMKKIVLSDDSIRTGYEEAVEDPAGGYQSGALERSPLGYSEINDGNDLQRGVFERGSDTGPFYWYVVESGIGLFVEPIGGIRDAGL